MYGKGPLPKCGSKTRYRSNVCTIAHFYTRNQTGSSLPKELHILYTTSMQESFFYDRSSAEAVMSKTLEKREWHKFDMKTMTWIHLQMKWGTKLWIIDLKRNYREKRVTKSTNDIFGKVESMDKDMVALKTQMETMLKNMQEMSELMSKIAKK